MGHEVNTSFNIRLHIFSCFVTVELEAAALQHELVISGWEKVNVPPASSSSWPTLFYPGSTINMVLKLDKSVVNISR